jgi:ABC-type tungstate transport system substrate-binding protein
MRHRWIVLVLILAAVLPAAAQRGGGRRPQGGGFRMGGYIPGRTQTLALAIFTDIQLGDTRGALRLVALCVALAFACVFTVERLLARSPHAPHAPGRPR